MKVKNKIDMHCKQLRLSALGSQVQHLADAAAARRYQLPGVCRKASGN